MHRDGTAARDSADHDDAAGSAGDPALRPTAGAVAVTPPAGWTVHHVDATGSTNADLARLAASGGANGTVLVADVQLAGRGRLGRTWIAPPGDALLFSVLLRPEAVPAPRRGWIGGIVGLAAVGALAELTGVRAALKWPNDVLVDGRKLAGILAEMVGDALVVGMGVNVTVSREALPRPDATSLLAEGAPREACDRGALLTAVLARLGTLLERWQAARGDVDGAGIRAEYLACCATIGSRVAVELPGGNRVIGTAVDVDTDGAIVIDDDNSVRRRFVAGDVIHLRREGGQR